MQRAELTLFPLHCIRKLRIITWRVLILNLIVVTSLVSHDFAHEITEQVHNYVSTVNFIQMINKDFIDNLEHLITIDEHAKILAIHSHQCIIFFNKIE